MKELILSLLPILAQVESNNNPNAVGDNGKALGLYQIHAGYWEDGCNFLEVDWPYGWAKKPKYASQIVTAYLMYYGDLYEKKTGKKATAEVLCRIHNSGPLGYKKKCSIPYWKKCKKAMEESK